MYRLCIFRNNIGCHIPIQHINRFNNNIPCNIIIASALNVDPNPFWAYGDTGKRRSTRSWMSRSVLV